jgi:hypothetical protein
MGGHMKTIDGRPLIFKVYKMAENVSF